MNVSTSMMMLVQREEDDTRKGKGDDCDFFIYNFDVG